MSLITPQAPRRFYRRWMDCLVPVILGCLISDEALGAQRMRLGTLVPKGSSYYNHLKTMESAWKRSPGGGVSTSIYPDGRLGGEAEMVRRMRGRQLQVGLLTVAGLAEIEQREDELGGVGSKDRGRAESWRGVAAMEYGT